MCLILISYRRGEDYPLIIAANRDEFFSRPTSPAHYWQDYPFILAGRDLEQGGTWMGITRQGEFAAVTNLREPPLKKSGAVSRGLLVSEYLTGSETPGRYMSKVLKKSGQYDAFNLLVGDESELCFLCSREKKILKLAPGLYGISNGDLDCPWPKVIRGKRLLGRELELNNGPDPERLLAILADREAAADSQLPDTGIGIGLERKLSPAFINMDGYGTRSSTVLIIDKRHQVEFVERTFNEKAEITDTVSFDFIFR